MVADREKLLFDEQDGPGDNARIVAEEQAAERRDRRGEIDKTVPLRLSLILHPPTPF